jgi:hypothetical protein
LAGTHAKGAGAASPLAGARRSALIPNLVLRLDDQGGVAGGASPPARRIEVFLGSVPEYDWRTGRLDDTHRRALDGAVTERGAERWGDHEAPLLRFVEDASHLFIPGREIYGLDIAAIVPRVMQAAAAGQDDCCGQ